MSAAVFKRNSYNDDLRNPNASNNLKYIQTTKIIVTVIIPSWTGMCLKFNSDMSDTKRETCFIPSSAKYKI